MRYLRKSQTQLIPNLHAYNFHDYGYDRNLMIKLENVVVKEYFDVINAL